MPVPSVRVEPGDPIQANEVGVGIVHQHFSLVEAHTVWENVTLGDAGMRELDVPTLHFTDRVEQAQQLLARRDHTPALADADREFLGNTLRSLRRVIGERGGAEQLLHGEPHPGNVLTTKNGLLFIDLETCCRGPVEFDLAHAPEEVSEHYPGVNQGLLRECRILVLAMITTWRWDRGDQLPNGRQLGTEWLSQIRAALDRNGLDTHG